MTPVIHPGLRDATATDVEGRNAQHRAGDHPAGCQLATLVANLGIHRPAPDYSYSDYAAGAVRHRPFCASDRNPGSGWAGVAARSCAGWRCSSGRADWRGNLLQPLAASISAIAPRLQVGPERHLWENGHADAEFSRGPRFNRRFSPAPGSIALACVTLRSFSPRLWTSLSRKGIDRPLSR